MEALEKCIKSQVNFDKKSITNIVSKFEALEIKKGDYFLKSGTICRSMAFIESGYLRMFDYASGKEITLWIGSNGRFITSLSSFIFQSTNYWNIQALTDCTLFVISRKNHVKLCEEDAKWLEFDNKLLANSFALLERTMFAQLHTTANDRFLSLMKEEPQLFNNVPLQYIASMLGITPESLSRLRKKQTHTIS